METENSVVVAVPFDDDAMEKKVPLKALDVVAENIEKSAPSGVVEPMPTRPPESTMKLFGAKVSKVEVLLEDATTKRGVVLSWLFAVIERSPHGVVEAMPTRPPAVAKYAEPVEVMPVVEAYGKVLATDDVDVMLPVMNALPWTASAVKPGVEVPMPTRPVFVITKSVEVA